MNSSLFFKRIENSNRVNNKIANCIYKSLDYDFLRWNFKLLDINKQFNLLKFNQAYGASR